MQSYQIFSLKSLCLALCLATFIMGGFNGCSIPKKNGGAANNQSTMPQQDYGQSAKNYLHLASKVQPPEQYEYQLLAADMYLKDQQANKAQDLLDKIPPESLPNDLKRQRQFLIATLKIQFNQPQAALKALQPFHRGNNLPSSSRAQFLTLHATAHEMQGNFLESAKSRSKLDSYLTSGFEQAQNRQALWQNLQKLPLSDLKTQQIKTSPDQFTGWAALAYITRQFDHQPAKMNQAMAKWRNMFPGHPASSMLSNRSAPQYHRLGDGPKQIALLLPLKGRYREAAQAIRDGFLANFYAAQSQYSSPPIIRFYDTTNTKDVYGIYRQAVREGADFVVGPLKKEAVLQLKAQAGHQLSTPVLALNQPPDDFRRVQGLYQFALSPEGEAELIASRAFSDGHQRALVVVPDNHWGKRIAKAFETRFEQEGGEVLKVSFIDPKEDQAKSIRKLLNVEKSQSRGMEIKQMIKEKVSFEPRRRQDVDVVILAAPPEQARQLRPLFDFYFAQNLPIYANSSIYGGTPNPKKDRDMNGVIFCDMPWLLSSNSNASKILQQSNQAHNLNLRLYAMGMDAFTLTTQIKKLEMSPYSTIPGATGTLSLNHNNQIERQLTWAKMKNGVPQRL